MKISTRNKLFTIGHSSHQLEYFFSLLKKQDINFLVDVRSVPFSKYTPQFNKEDLKKFLLGNGIYYLFMGQEFGARREDTSLYTDEGYLNFEKVAKSKLFNVGIERIITGIEKGFRIAFMCTEKDPVDCHRNILVARAFYKLNYAIDNILENGKIQDQASLEKRLLDMYFPDRMQQTLFDSGETMSDTELINEAYRLRNKDIGYRIVEERESITI